MELGILSEQQMEAGRFEADYEMRNGSKMPRDKLCQILGISERTLTGWRGKSEYRVYVEKLKQEQVSLSDADEIKMLRGRVFQKALEGDSASITAYFKHYVKEDFKLEEEDRDDLNNMTREELVEWTLGRIMKFSVKIKNDSQIAEEFKKKYFQNLQSLVSG